MTPRPDKTVEVFAPTNLGRSIADEIESALMKYIESLPTATLIRLLRAGEAIARERSAFERFRQQLGVE